MDKKTLTAVVLSMAVIILWQMFIAKPVQPPAPGQETTAAVNAPAATPSEQAKAPEAQPMAQVPAATLVPQKTEPEQTIEVDTPLYTAKFSSMGGTVTQWTLKEYQEENQYPGNPLTFLSEWLNEKHAEEEMPSVNLVHEEGPYGALAIGWNNDFSVSDYNFSISGGDIRLSESRPTGTLVFTLATGQYSIKRTYTFHYESYVVDIQDEVSGTPGYQITLGDNFGMHLMADRYSHTGPVVLRGDKLKLLDKDNLEGIGFINRKILGAKSKPEVTFPGEEVKWIALESKYFCSALVPKGPTKSAKAWKKDESGAIAFEGEPGVNEFSLYAGPKLQENLEVAGGGLESIVDFGFFSIIARPIFWLLKQLYSIIGNYGWAIVALTIVVRVPFIPIVSKGQRSMKRMQEIQPLMAQVKEKYKNDPKRMQAEMMNVYKKHKVNPMGGCLPMLVQIPVFFALYRVLLVAIELRGAPWMFWIQDLAAKDPSFILPVVMGGTMFIQQKMTPTGGDPKQQKIMMFMPLVMTFVFLNFPSGLVVYWLTNNILSIIQQFFVNRKKEEPAAA